MNNLKDFRITDFVDDTETFINEWYEFKRVNKDYDITIEEFLNPNVYIAYVSSHLINKSEDVMLGVFSKHATPQFREQFKIFLECEDINVDKINFEEFEVNKSIGLWVETKGYRESDLLVYFQEVKLNERF